MESVPVVSGTQQKLENVVDAKDNIFMVTLH